MLRVSLELFLAEIWAVAVRSPMGAGDHGWQRGGASKSILTRLPHGAPLAVTLTAQPCLDPSHLPSWAASFPADAVSLPEPFR